MKKGFLFHLLFSCLLATNAQFADDFSDSDLSLNPTWLGDTSLFTTDANLMLQLYNLTPNSTNNNYIYTNSESIDNAVWKLNCNLNFTPSSSNFARVYLVSNNQNFSGNLNGYFVELGRSNRKIALYKQTGTTTTELITSNNDILSQNLNKIYIEVTRDDLGNWELAFDTSATQNNLQIAGNANDFTHRFTKYFGIHCRYTTTRAQHFFFDNIEVTGNAYIDTSSFLIEEIDIKNDTQIVITFSKTPENVQASNILNYQTNPTLGAISNAVILANTNQVQITFSSTIPFSTLFNLQLNNITDLFGNALLSNNFPFYRIAKHDLIISEIMANPNGADDLPQFRYIEIFNNLNFPIFLKNWKIHVGATSRTIAEVNIPAQKHFIITDSSAMHLYPNVISSYIMPFFALSNNGATIRLRDNKNMVIDSISYTNIFFEDCIAAQGGFALEKINLLDFCQFKNNWKASKHIRGGTPGFPNEVKSTIFAPLSVNKIEVTDANTVKIEFNRPLNAISITNFAINNVSISNLEQVNQTIWQLKLQQSLTPNTSYNLSLSNILDSCNLVNPLQQTIPIIYYLPEENDLVITELMFRPEPAIGLPTVQYIELKNRTNFPISLENWELKINNSTYILPFGMIEPDSFILIIRQRDAFQNNYENNSVLYTCDAINLSTSGTRISLFSNKGKLINSINYSANWHAANKQNGGWSLELTNPDASCLSEKVWKSSRDTLGGTPGKTNSWQETQIIPSENYITNFGVNAADSIVLYLNKAILNQSCDSLDFIIYPNETHPQKIYYSAPEQNKIYLKLPFNLQENTAYQIIINETGLDCIGNKISKDTIKFELAKNIAPKELIINEILFNPKQDGVDFVEIYNNSLHAIDLKGIFLGNFDSLLNEPINQKPIHNESLYILPQQYLSLSANKDTVLSHYYSPNYRKGFWNISSMPSFSNSEGSVSLSENNLKTYDQMYYNEKWHYKLLTDPKGASLERIYFNENSNNSNNWHTAASTVGFATPGYKNSQMGAIENFAEQWVSLSSEYISPDLDGYQDFLEINYSVPEAGYLGTFEIFTAQGISVRKITENELLAQNGTFIWDGINNNGEKAKIGICILYASFIHPQGKTYSVKKTFVVAGKL